MLDFRGLAEGHRTPSEQRIIAANQGRSTPKFNNLRVIPGAEVPASGDFAVPTRNSLFLIGSSQRDFRELALADLVDVIRTGLNLCATVLDALTVDPDGALLDHAEGLGRAADESGLL